jgi:uncharacterized protein
MNDSKQINRRGFLKTSTLGIVGAGVMGNNLLQAEEKETPMESPKIKEYRTLGRTGFKTSDIGIGSSRAFDVPVIEALLDAGVNYIDTAESYGRGNSEKAVGKAIEGRDRKKLFITSKLHLKETATKEEVLSRFRKCLERLNTDYIDALLLHSATEVAVFKNEGFHQAVKQLKSESKLRFIGISNHGSRRPGNDDNMEKTLMAAIQDGRFDLFLLVYNFLQKDAGERVLAACKEKNIAATIMKSDPSVSFQRMQKRVADIKKQGKEVDERTQSRFDKAKESADKANLFVKKYKLQNPGDIHEAAIRFVLNNPNANVLNLAFKTFDDVEKYLSLSGSRLTMQDKQKLAAYSESMGQLYCRHACGICETQCPHNVPVNTIMRYSHYFEISGSEKYAMEKYMNLDTAKANHCNTCTGHCESACPYNVPAKSLLSMAHNQLTLG